MVFGLATLGFVLLVLGILAIFYPPGLALTGLPFAVIGLGLVLILIGSIVAGLTSVFDFILKYWFIFLPIFGFIAFKFFFKKKQVI